MDLTEFSDCGGVGEVLGQIGDRWTVMIVVALIDHPRRFNELKRSVLGISQQMLARTLRALERDGLIVRTVANSSPPQVEYALSSTGRSLSTVVGGLAEWAIVHRTAIATSRQSYDRTDIPK
ncbi:winged helix-turn-helix transcriptional regulator [Neorhizobium sp. DAR64872/K0K18]|uniref:winged helix-turn-helix transcriptional regulator n=1 Tax=Neorhizobium sp. DAR64872/K0K18 TaxID=3421958 RepID=UPI003D29D0EF